MNSIYNKRKLYLFGTLFLFFILGLCYVFTMQNDEEFKRYDVTEFPTVELLDFSNEKVLIGGNQKKIVVFVGENCNACHELIRLISQSPLSKRELKIYYIWKEKHNNLNSQHRGNVFNLILDEDKLENRKYGTLITPHTYLLDEKNNVIINELGSSPALVKKLERLVENN